MHTMTVELYPSNKCEKQIRVEIYHYSITYCTRHEIKHASLEQKNQSVSSDTFIELNNYSDFFFLNYRY